MLYSKPPPTPLICHFSWVERDVEEKYLGNWSVGPHDAVSHEPEQLQGSCGCSIVPCPETLNDQHSLPMREANPGMDSKRKGLIPRAACRFIRRALEKRGPPRSCLKATSNIGDGEQEGPWLCSAMHLEPHRCSLSVIRNSYQPTAVLCLLLHYGYT